MNVLRSEGMAKTNFHNYPTGVVGYVNGCEERGRRRPRHFLFAIRKHRGSAGFYHDVVLPETARGLLPSA
jgi:hypothetical protein